MKYQIVSVESILYRHVIVKISDSLNGVGEIFNH